MSNYITIKLSRPEAVEFVHVMTQASDALRAQVTQTRHDARKYPKSEFFADRATDAEYKSMHFEDVFMDILRKIVNEGIRYEDFFPQEARDDVINASEENA